MTKIKQTQRKYTKEDIKNKGRNEEDREKESNRSK